MRADNMWNAHRIDRRQPLLVESIRVKLRNLMKGNRGPVFGTCALRRRQKMSFPVDNGSRASRVQTESDF